MVGGTYGVGVGVPGRAVGVIGILVGVTGRGVGLSAVGLLVGGGLFGSSEPLQAESSRPPMMMRLDHPFRSRCGVRGCLGFISQSFLEAESVLTGG